MKSFFVLVIAGLLASFTAFSQARLVSATASLEAASGAGSAARSEKSEVLYNSFRPMTIRYKDTPRNLMVVDVAQEKQVLHFTEKQLEKIAAIIEAKDGKTHYLEVTNFYDVYAGKEKAAVDQDFLKSMEAAMERLHWYKNNAVLMISSTMVGEEHVIRFKLPFANDARVCRHVKALHNLKEDYYEATPADFMKLLVSEQTPATFKASTN